MLKQRHPKIYLHVHEAELLHHVGMLGTPDAPIDVDLLQSQYQALKNLMTDDPEWTEYLDGLVAMLGDLLELCGYDDYA